jgi:hypothetical protein
VCVIVHEPQVREVGDEVIVEAVVDVGSVAAPRLHTVFFAFPRRLAAWVDARADGFAAAVLPLAMHAGEPLEVRGELSLKLAAGLREYQRIQCAWKPWIFREVELRADRLVSREAGAAAGGVASAFSGGVDSFFTVQRHLAAAEPFAPYRVTCCLMINGFDDDASVADPPGFEPVRRAYEPALVGLGVDLVVVRTNLLELLGQRLRSQSFDTFLAAPALILGRLLSRLYIPSGCKVTTMGLFPDGCHLMLDHLLSSESLDVVHDGAEVTRVEKTVAISSWPVTYDALRVCHGRTVGAGTGPAIRNCGACDKCVRTMVTLEVAGALGRYRTFPLPLDRRQVRDVDLRAAASRLFTDELIEFAASGGRYDLVRDLRTAVRRSLHFWPRLGPIAMASRELERRFRPWSWIVSVPKRGLKRVGWGQGWLY